MTKIGIYICECGPNIKDRVDIPALENFSKELKDVSFVRVFNILCSPAGLEVIKKDIKEHELTRVVIAACSPREHEHTFAKTLEEAGINPFLLQIANIREQCAWVIKDKTLATEKAKRIIKAAVERVRYHEPLETKEIDCIADVLVVGAGISGISAASTLAQKNRTVYLVERSPVIGGRAARYEKLFPNMECASCLFTQRFDDVLHHERIKVSTLSEVEEVKGFYGNFIVKVKKKPRYVDPATCIGCGACFEACPVKVKDEYNGNLSERKAIYIPYPGALPNTAVIDEKNCLYFKNGCDACKKVCPFNSINYGEEPVVQELKVGSVILATGFDEFNPGKAPEYGTIEDVYTGLQFERLVNADGPTKGKILLKNGELPKEIALVHCAGSRSRKYNEYCSGVCCAYLSKFARIIKDKLPKARVTEFYTDICPGGKGYQAFFNGTADKLKVDFVRMKNSDSIKLSKAKKGISIKCEDSNGKMKKGRFDLVVLAGAMEAPDGAKRLSQLFDIPLNEDGFFSEAQAQLSPTVTIAKGVFIAGCANGPKDIPGSISEAFAAASGILQNLLPGEKLTLNAMTSVVEDHCSGCKVCVSLCPYHAITYDKEKKQACINEALCTGCGICAGACPSAAIKARHFTDKQILAEINGILIQKEVKRKTNE